MKGELTGIDLRAEQHKEVVRLLQHHLPDTEVWAYGSRVKCAARPASDLDLVTFASAGRPKAVSRLREAFDESPLPFRVDLFVWDKAPEEFRKNIEEARIVVQEKEKKNSPKGWETVAIGEISEVIGGGTPSSKVDEYWGGSIPWLTPKDLSGYDFRRVKSGKRNITDSGLANSSARLLPKNTVLVTSRAPIGYVALADNEIATNQGFKSLILNDGYDPDFFYYLIKHNVPTLEAVSSGTTFKEISGKAFKQIKFNVPPLPEQKAIAHILGSLDDKIELNRRMNETLEAMAQAIFKDWFVDFGPTRAKAESHAPYLTSEIWDIFPDALDDEDKPVGWQIGSIGDLANTNHQSWTVRNHPATVEYVDLSNAKWGNIDAVTAFAWKDAPSRARRVARMGDTIVGTTRPGNGSFVYISQNGLTVSTGFSVLSPREVIYQDVVYIAATRLDNIERLANLADGHGGAYPAVKPKEVSDTELVLPGDAILSAFADLVSPLRAKIENVKVESRSLSQTRDLLLPKLMSGEIRLREAERVVEAVV